MRDLELAIRGFAATTALLFLVVAALAVMGYVVAQRTNSALCALDADVAARISSSQAFLVAHPDGFAGLPAATIEKSIRDQERTLNALSVLHCKGAES